MNTLGKKKVYACSKLNIRIIQVCSDSLLGIFSMQSQNNLQLPYFFSFGSPDITFQSLQVFFF